MTGSTSTSDAASVEVVRAMVAAWDRMDWDEVVNLFAADGVLQSMMQEPLVGQAAIRDRMQSLTQGLERIELRVRAIGVIDGRVFLERLDVFDVNGHHGEVPVVGVLTVRDGRVHEWLEYYDRATLIRGMGLDPAATGH